MTQPVNQLVVIGSLAVEEITSAVVKSEDFMAKYNLMVETQKKLDALKKDIDEKVKQVMRDEYMVNGENKVVVDDSSITYIPGTMRETFDSAALKEADPETYKKYVKVTSVKDAIRYTKKPKKEKEGE